MSARIPLPERLIVAEWCDPAAADGFTSPMTSYSLTYWLPIVGPTALLAGQRLAAIARPDRCTPILIEMLAASLGVSPRHGGRDETNRNSPLARAFGQLVTYGLIRWVDPTKPEEGIEARTLWPRLTPRLVSRLPPSLQAAHERHPHPPASTR
jgi:hypothetical protein